MVERCSSSGGRGGDEVLATLERLEIGDPRRDDLLDALAAASDAPPVVDTLVRVIYQERFARAEIRKILVGDAAAAEEALQETALAMVRGLPSFRGDSTFRTWVCAIARNQAIGVLRRMRPTVELTGEPGEVARYSSMLASRSDLERAIAQLPEHFRRPVVLRDLEQRSYEEIAALLGIELNTVRSRLARGRARLTAAFAAGPPPGGGGTR